MSLWMSYSRVRGVFNQNKTMHGGHVKYSEILRLSDNHAHLRIPEKKAEWEKRDFHHNEILEYFDFSMH